MDQRIRKVVFVLLGLLLILGAKTGCAVGACAENEVKDLYHKYLVDRAEAFAPAAVSISNQQDSVFIDFEIPWRRRLYSVAFVTNSAFVTFNELNRMTGKRSAGEMRIVRDIDVELINSFKRALSLYRYGRVVLKTTGSKYVYVTIPGEKRKCYNFDFPGWADKIASLPGASLQLDPEIANAYRLYITLFNRYIFPCMNSL